MRGKNTIIINGRQYDAVTGLAVGELPHSSKPKVEGLKVVNDISQKKVVPVKKIPNHHVPRNISVKKPVSSLQKSKTLRRESLRRPVGIHESTVSRHMRSHTLVQKSSVITKFADHPQQRTYIAPAPQIHTDQSVGIRPAHKPMMVHVLHKATARPQVSKPVALSSRQLKEKLISEKLASVDHHKKQIDHKPARKLFGAHPRTASVMSACFALVVLGGYLTYLNMPNLSIRVAAAQAGVNARFPEYRPDGYRFNGPIAYAPGEVTMYFQSNGGKQAYEIKQKNSSWDSQAVLDNYVTKESKAYLTYSEQGLTVYTYQNKAAWVNGGVLYTIDGDAPLSNEQVLRIAASM